MSTTQAGLGPDRTQAGALDQLFGSLWPEADPAARPRLVAAAVAVGLLAAVVLPFRMLGLGTVLVLAAVATPGVVARWPRRTPYLLTSVGLAGLLLAVPAVRAAEWVAVLCVLAAGAVLLVALVDARTAAGVVGTALAAPLAGLRGLPWLSRSVRGPGPVGVPWSVLRTALVSLVLVSVFAALFASADALFARWLDAMVPDLTVDTILLRLVVLGAAGGASLAGAYVALNPPRTDRLASTPARPVPRAFEWLVPVGLVVVVYVGFLAAQLTVMFGGHDHLRATTGLTYAEYVHQGFGQLTVATALTLGVVAVAGRKAPRHTPRDRAVVRLVLGALCALTLVVVASALFRLELYADAYGLTRLRLLVAVFEGWLGLLVVLLMAAGVRLRAGWLPRAAVLTGAASLLGLAALNPDAYVAQRNVERYAVTGKVDLAYLAGLSADAVPALDRLPERDRGCVLGQEADERDWLEWNLGAARAAGREPGTSAGCVYR